MLLKYPKFSVEIPGKQAALGQDFFFFNLFHVDHFKVFIEFVTILLLLFFFFLNVLVFWSQDIWNFSFPTRD